MANYNRRINTWQVCTVLYIPVFYCSVVELVENSNMHLYGVFVFAALIKYNPDITAALPKNGRSYYFGGPYSNAWFHR